jgi:hypothetical protein
MNVCVFIKYSNIDLLTEHFADKAVASKRLNNFVSNNDKFIIAFQVYKQILLEKRDFHLV